ncbi:Uncharacterised protein [Scardovia inopinata]|uniref:Uncharacterized protein n=1 Tax=Scardovia inopinata F0304 TaxID=641146 RepID=W5II96_SCAIO|nr:hypothetical protein [Scardovia inopinata]EFG26580.1 hypothetical protein HMPREF9020_00202 [Scardovia inopinata F0304]BAR06177.1 hypothetical protein SCIP_0110 [Scardovia inopinata JCM 12537]SUV51697.1 Uncharacterised protein [Scardovia inopinata]
MTNPSHSSQNHKIRNLLWGIVAVLSLIIPVSQAALAPTSLSDTAAVSATPTASQQKVKVSSSAQTDQIAATSTRNENTGYRLVTVAARRRVARRVTRRAPVRRSRVRRSRVRRAPRRAPVRRTPVRRPASNKLRREGYFHGEYCRASRRGTKTIDAKNGNIITCKVARDGRLRWTK